jgi:hypothetical protein
MDIMAASSKTLPSAMLSNIALPESRDMKIPTVPVASPNTVGNNGRTIIPPPRPSAADIRIGGRKGGLDVGNNLVTVSPQSIMIKPASSIMNGGAVLVSTPDSAGGGGGRRPTLADPTTSAANNNDNYSNNNSMIFKPLRRPNPIESSSETHHSNAINAAESEEQKERMRIIEQTRARLLGIRVQEQQQQQQQQQQQATSYSRRPEQVSIRIPNSSDKKVRLNG